MWAISRLPTRLRHWREKGMGMQASSGSKARRNAEGEVLALPRVFCSSRRPPDRW